MSNQAAAEKSFLRTLVLMGAKGIKAIGFDGSLCEPSVDEYFAMQKHLAKKDSQKAKSEDDLPN